MLNGQAAEQDIEHLLLDHGADQFEIHVIRHNLVVSMNGESALKILPYLLDIISEATLNLTIHHPKQNEIQEAH